MSSSQSFKSIPPLPQTMFKILFSRPFWDAETISTALPWLVEQTKPSILGQKLAIEQHDGMAKVSGLDVQVAR